MKWEREEAKKGAKQNPPTTGSQVQAV